MFRSFQEASQRSARIGENMLEIFTKRARNGSPYALSSIYAVWRDGDYYRRRIASCNPHVAGIQLLRGRFPNVQKESFTPRPHGIFQEKSATGAHTHA